MTWTGQPEPSRSPFAPHARAVAPELAPTPPADIAWTPAEVGRLAAGRTVCRHHRTRDVDLGLAAVRVRAPVEAVWRQVLDFDAYASFLPYVTASSLDAVRPGEPDVYEASFQLTTKGVITHYRVQNHCYLRAGWMPFALVPEHGGTLRRATGSWQVQGDGSGALVIYRLRAAVSWWVPGFARRLAATRGLPALTELVARRAERDAT